MTETQTYDPTSDYYELGVTLLTFFIFLVFNYFLKATGIGAITTDLGVIASAFIATILTRFIF